MKHQIGQAWNPNPDGKMARSKQASRAHINTNIMTMDGQSLHPRTLPGPTTPKAHVIDSSLRPLRPPTPTRNINAIIRKDYGKTLYHARDFILGLGIEGCTAQLGDDDGDPTTACAFFNASSSFPSLPGDTITSGAGMNFHDGNGGVVMFSLLSEPTRLVRPRVQRFRPADEATRGALPVPLFPSLATPPDRSSPMPFMPKLTGPSGAVNEKWKLGTRPAKMDDSLLAI